MAATGMKLTVGVGGISRIYNEKAKTPRTSIIITSSTISYPNIYGVRIELGNDEIVECHDVESASYIFNTITSFFGNLLK
jgi:hypothetical protein